MSDYGCRSSDRLVFVKEPDMPCPVCGEQCEADFVDNGFGPYAVQAGPQHCSACGWIERGCPHEGSELCASCTSEHICRATYASACKACGNGCGHRDTV